MKLVHRKWVWAKKKPLFWANLCLVLFTVLVLWFIPGPTLATGPSDLRLRSWGMVLQMIGVITVWIDLTSAARKFGEGGFFRSIVPWLRECFARPKTVTATVSGRLSISGSACGTTRRGINPMAPLQDRITALEDYVQQVDGDLGSLHKEFDKRIGALNTQVKAESASRESAVRVIHASLKEAATENVAILAFGVVWLAIGSVLTTFSPEIVRVVAGQWSEVWVAF